MLVWDGPILYSLRQAGPILSGEVEQLDGRNRHNLPGSAAFSVSILQGRQTHGIMRVESCVCWEEGQMGNRL
jgi:hypothetical protein